MSREILEQIITKQNDGTFYARVEVIEGGERASLTDNFPSFDEANQWVVAIEQGLDVAPNDTIPEPPASEMTPEDAERINSNVVPAPKPNGAASIPNGEQAGADLSTSAADTQTPAEDQNTSSEVAGTQDATEVAHNSSNQPAAEQGSEEQSPTDPNETQDETATDGKDTTETTSNS